MSTNTEGCARLESEATLPMARLIELETAEHERDILRTENAALKREAHTWSKAAEHYAKPLEPLDPLDIEVTDERLNRALHKARMFRLAHLDDLGRLHLLPPSAQPLVKEYLARRRYWTAALTRHLSGEK